MPHVIINGPVNPEDIWLAFRPLEFKENGNLFKAEEAYLDSEKQELLIRSLVIERGFKRKFFVRITSRPDGIHMGIDPLAAPDKSDGVKRLLGFYALAIMQAEPEALIGVTNIQEFLGEPAP